MVLIVFLFIIGILWIILKFIVNRAEGLVEYKQNNIEPKKLFYFSF